MKTKTRKTSGSTGWILLMPGRYSGIRCFVKLDDREDYGEDRWMGIGMMSHGIVVVFIFTETDQETIRMISMRKATKNERTRYEKAIKDELDKN